MWLSNAMIVIGAWTLVAVMGLIVLTVRAGRRLKRLEKQFAWAAERIGQLEVRNEGRSYVEAITLARRGANPDRLMTNFGLSRGEADLIALMHNQRKAG